MRINQAVLTLLCAAVLFVPASRDVDTTTSTPAVRATAALPVSLDVACARAAADPDSLVAMLTGLSAATQPPDLCVDTIECGGCCGNRHQVVNFLRCCERGGGFACARRFGCR